MASDSFTDTDGTLLSAHGPNTWIHWYANPDGIGAILNNQLTKQSAQAFFEVRCSSSSSRYNQIVFKAGSWEGDSKRIAVCATDTREGYELVPTDLTGDIFGSLTLRKNGVFQDLALVSMSRLSDHTIALNVSVSGEITVSLDGVLQTWNDAAGTIFSDASPLTGGNPAIACFGMVSSADADYAFDDWTDTAPGTAPVLSAPTPSGTIGTQTTATIGATTTQSTGNFYVVVDSSANLAGVTATQIKAGQRASGAAAAAAGDVAVSTTSPSVGVTGLVANTAYAYAAVQNNANGDSNIVTGTFTTASATAASGTTPGPLSGRRIAILMQS